MTLMARGPESQAKKVEVALRYEVAEGSIDTAERSGALSAVDQRDLADHIPGAERRQLHLRFAQQTSRDSHATVLENVHSTRRIALLAQRFSRLQGEGPGDRQNLVQLSRL